MKIRKLLAATFGCFALLFGTTAAHAAETTVAKIGETPYSSLNEAIKAVQTGETITLVSDATVVEGIFTRHCTKATEYTLDLNGRTLFAGANIVLNAVSSEDVYCYVPTTVTVKNGKFHATHDFGCFWADDGCVATIENVAFTSEGNSITAGSLAGCKEGTAVFKGNTQANGEQNAYVFKGCTFKDCYVYLQGKSNCAASNATFDGCAFTLTGEKYVSAAVSIHHDISGSVDFNDCAFAITNFAKSSSTTRSAVAIDSDARTEAGLSISLKDTTFTGTTNPKGGSVSLIDNSGELEKKTTTVALTGETSVTVDGTAVESPVPNAVASVNGTHYADLAAALKAAIMANDGKPVEILRDITFAPGDTWTPVTFSAHATLVVNGNGKTITGIPGMLLDVYAAGGGAQTLRMRELTFKDAKVENAGSQYGAGHEANQHVSVILGYGGNVSELTFEKVTVDHATVTGDEYAAAFVAFATLDSDDSVVTFTDCKVLNSTITGGGSVGALMGHANANTVGKVVVSGEATEIRNNTIVSNEADASKVKAGAVFGSVGNAPTFVSANVRDNNVTSSGNSITTVYGRQASVGGRLFLTGGTYDHAPIADSDAAWAKVAEGCTLAGNDTDGWTVEYFVKANGVGYATLEAAFAAAEPDADGVVTYEIGGKAEVTGAAWVKILKDGLTGVTQVKFVGTTDDAEICLVTAGSILSEQTYDVDVTLTDLTLSRLNPAWVGDIGHGANYFSTWLRNLNAAENTVTYTRCTFPNGVCNNPYGKTVFNDCMFSNDAEGLFNLWVYGGDVKVNGGTFTGTRGVKVYNEGAARDDISVKIANTTFRGLTEKAAVVASKQADIALDNIVVTGCAQGFFAKELAGEIDPTKESWMSISANGTAISGTFNITTSMASTALKTEFNLTGGTFTTAVDADYCAKGYEPTANDDGTYGVQAHIIAKVGGEEFNSLADAFKAAVAAKNATVEIVDDITFEAGDTWMPVRIGSDKTLVVNGNGKTIKNLPGCLFGTTHETEAQFGSVFTMTNLKFENPKATAYAASGKQFVAVVLALAYGMDVTLDGVEIDGADVRGGNDSFVAGFVGWCNGVTGGGRKTVTLRNCALRNSTLVSCGSVGGLVASTTPTLNEAVELVVENCEVVGNTIVGTELKDGVPRTELVGSVVGSIGAGDATVSATVSGNSVYGSTSAVDAETLTKDTDEVTAVYGRGNGGELTITGGSYDARPFNEGDDWAKVGEWSKLVEKDGVFKVVDNLATLGNVKARQRYPWNGLVDITFELKSKNAALVFIVAEYVDGGETKRLPMAAAKLVNDDKSESVDVSTGFTVPAQATAKTIHVIWDSTAAVPTRLSGVTFKVYAK